MDRSPQEGVVPLIIAQRKSSKVKPLNRCGCYVNSSVIVPQDRISFRSLEAVGCLDEGRIQSSSFFLRNILKGERDWSFRRMSWSGVLVFVAQC